MNSVELSVIVPVYNVEEYLERCLDSILTQTYRVGEIICVDDGSTDSSRYILDEYQLKYQNLIVLHKENGGLVSARKAGLNLATGKYVTYVDSDDWIEENMYENLVELIKVNQADMVTSGCIRDYGTHVVNEYEKIEAGVYEGEILKKDIWEKMIDTENFFRSNLSIHIYNKIYTRELLEQYQMNVDDDINVGEDAACVYPCILGAKKVVISGLNFYHYCIRSDSIMGKRNADELPKLDSLFKKLKHDFSRKWSFIDNILVQLKCLETYEKLLQVPSSVIKKIDEKIYPIGAIKKGDRIVIYGSGRFGVSLSEELSNLGYTNIVAWVDKKGEENKEVKPVTYLNKIDFDVLIIAVLIADVVEEIKTELKNMGVDEKKIYTVNSEMIAESVENKR